MPATASTFTAKFIATAKPGRNPDGSAKPIEYSDAISPLRLAVQPSGHRSYIVRYRRPEDGKPAKLTLRAETLASARLAATAALLQLEKGIDPSPRRSSGIRAKVGDDDSIEAAVASFLDLHARRKNRRATILAAEGVFKREVLPAWRGRDVQDIRKRDVIDLVENIAASGRGHMANRTLAILSKFFGWLVARDRLPASPVTGAERPYVEKARERTLTDAELRSLFLACEDDEPFGSALRLIILTGGRRNEISQMRWSEIDPKRRMWTLPAERSKNGRAHDVPLSTQAWDIVSAQASVNGSDFVFTLDGRTGIVGWDKAKKRLSARAGIPEADWRLHDARRTCASGMQRLGIRTEAIERALNHRSGIYHGIVATYQTDRLEDEVAIALQRWGAFVTDLVSDRPPQNVVSLGKRR